MARWSYEDELSLLENGSVYGWAHDEDGNLEAVDEFGRTPSQILATYRERANRLNAVSAVYQRADRIITGDSDLTVSVVSDPAMKTNAISNGREIIFNANLIADFDSENIMHLHGLNYHELAHVLFSPRAGSNLVQYVKTNEYRTAYYVLEEARAEALLVAKYPITRLFLESATTTYLLNDPKEMGNYFPIITGRMYLPLEIRQKVADEFIAKHGIALATTIHRLIHEYRTLVFPNDFDKAKAIIEEMAGIYGKDTDRNPDMPHVPQPCDLPVRGRPEGNKEQIRLQERNKKGKDESESLANGRESAEGNTSDNVKTAEITFDQEDKTIAELLNERMKVIKDNDIVKREVNETRKAILDSDEVRGAVKPCNYESHSVSAKGMAIARQFGRELERITRDNEPKWDRFNSRGKLNITRTMNPNVNAIRTMFDQWDIGNPDTEIEAVILTDTSSSMGGMTRSVMENNWIIKRGIESINGKVTCMAFSSETKLLYGADEKAKPNHYRHLWANGNTNPIRGLIEAERILTMSKKPIKLAFVITDGEWHNTEQCDSIMKSMNDKGILTCVVFLGAYKEYKEMLERASRSSDGTEFGDEIIDGARRWIKTIRHNSQVFRAVSTPKDVLDVARDVVKSTLNTNFAVA